MLTELLKRIRENSEKYKEGIKKRGAAEEIISRILELDKDWRGFTAELESLRAEQNTISKNKNFSQDEIERAKNVKVRIKEIEADLKPIEEELDGLLFELPNLPDPEMPVGKDENDNKVVRQIGQKTEFDFQPKDYLEIAENLGWIDVKKAAEVSGSRFGYLKDQAALLEISLIHYVFSILANEEILKEIISRAGLKCSAKTFIPVIPPMMIKPEVYARVGRLSREDKEEKYFLEKDNLYLAGSAEHTLAPLHMDETLREEDLPIRYVGFSTCFRREAGSYGKDTKGILRVHQFDKIEMESFSVAEEGREEQKLMVAIQEYLVDSLQIPYQVIDVCAGDTGRPDARQFDIECWIPSEGKYRETHSADYNSDYQAMRLNTRVKRKDGRTEFIHMNDATGFAIGRIIIAIIENYQQEDGSVKIPDILKKYL